MGGLFCFRRARRRTAEARFAGEDKRTRTLSRRRASWINLVERVFGLITDGAIRRGVFCCVAELETAIEAYLEQHRPAQAIRLNRPSSRHP